MEKIIINKEFLKDYETLTLFFENLDIYEINVNDIIDIYCEVESLTSNIKYKANNGFIKIKSKTVISKKNSQNNNTFIIEDDYILTERLNYGDGSIDITSFKLKNKESNEIEVLVSYNPLIEIIHGYEIEYSNCSSVESDNDENILIYFGESSKQPKRKDNNYSELIIGWSNIFGSNQPKTLKMLVNSFKTFGEDNINFELYFKIKNKYYINKYMNLLFLDCGNLEMDLNFPDNGECELIMSKMNDGRIFVGLYGQGIQFYCSKVIEYSEYYKF